ncbi:MAG: PilZ domain-containing protein, partial [Planctomycetota bacterium]
SSDGEAPVGLSSHVISDVDEIAIAPEDVAFDEFANANATESADPFALPDAFVGDLIMPQGRPVTKGAAPPSDANPITGSGERDGMTSAATAALTQSSTDSNAVNAQRVSARFKVEDCKARFGRGGFPEDTSPEHPLDLLSTKGATFSLDSQDELASTVEKGDELWVRISVPAFIEPVMVRGVVQRIGGNSDGARGGTRLEIEWKDVDANVSRKLARAAETLGATA